jgi:hypothetical protein
MTARTEAAARRAPRTPSAALLLALALVIALPLGASGYEVVPVADGATIQGKVLFKGEVPMKKIIPSKDKDTCGAIREEPEITVAADKGVLEAVVWLKGVEKGKPFASAAATPEIVNKGCTFHPHVQAIPVGGVVIVNADPVMHNTHGFAGKATVFNVALPLQNQRIERPLKKPGMMRVECDTHGWMLAWIYVAESPYYAVTAKDGTFSIKDVPPGDYTLTTWHELTGEVETPVTVKAKETAKLTVELKK